ncbi:MAG TPA: hypothetical protein VMR54_16415 [Thermoanaerobaculia bacterium]|nr:hypothetical protein [Thermoanaerobaculia bacterium]
MRTPRRLAILGAFMLTVAARALGSPGSRYDPKTEITVSGTVDEVKVYSRQGSVAGGVHLLLKTSDSVLDIHLGPSGFLKEKSFDVVKGDAIEVIGSKVKVNDKDAVIARQVKKGEKSWTLRSASGVPEWSGGPKGR